MLRDLLTLNRDSRSSGYYVDVEKCRRWESEVSAGPPMDDTVLCYPFDR